VSRHVVRKPSPATSRQAVRGPAHRDLSTLRPRLISIPGQASSVYPKSQSGGYLDSGYGSGPITQSDLACWPVRRPIDGRIRAILLVAAGVRWRFPRGGTAAFEGCQRGRKAMPGPPAGNSGLMQAATTPPWPCGGAQAGGRTDSRGKTWISWAAAGCAGWDRWPMLVAARSTILGRAARLPPLIPPPVTTPCSRRTAGTDHGRWARVRAGRAEPAPAVHVGV
jgi:hypothetical protein